MNVPLRHLRRTALASGLLVASLVGGLSHAGDLSAGDPLLVSLVDESKALEDTVEVIKAEVRNGKLDISTAAKLSWQKGAAQWAEVRAFANAGLWESAYRDAHIARLLCEKGAYEVFSARASRNVQRTVADYVDAVEPRLEALRKRIMRLPDHGVLLTQWSQARDTLQSAKRLAAVDQVGSAWPTLISAAGLVDKLVQEVVRRAPDDEGSVTP